MRKINALNRKNISMKDGKKTEQTNQSNNESNARKKYFVNLMYDAIIGSDNSNESRELAIETLTNTLEKFIKAVISEEKNKILLEVRNEVIKNIEEYIKSNINTSRNKTFLNDTSFVLDILQNINEAKKLAQGSQAITKDTNEKSEMIIERLDKFEKDVKRKIDNIENLIEHSKRNENLTTTDKQILNFIKEKGIVCADDVQNVFTYKGKNAASARLNILYRKNYLEKIIRNKKVYYKILDDRI